ncbi:glycoside hydrolase family 99-like domain-containing protein [Empedobacter falsenii]
MIKPIAIHLPQFHPFPENDEWWGKGFTEWTNVTNATPYFKGHYQPQLPSDLGFYDLRLKEARLEQIKLAKEYGIYGFCYYYYWFNGKRLMNEPLDRMLSNKEEDFPFMYCWANENWTRRWDGLDQEILIKQNYSDEDDLNHIRYLCENVFSDNRYIKVDNKPFFVIYRPALLPDIKKTVQKWRDIAFQEYGIELYIGYMTNFSYSDDDNIFDAVINFEPDFSNMPTRKAHSKLDLFKGKYFNKKLPLNDHYIYDYSEYIIKAKKKLKINNTTFPSITPSWDNSARRKIGATIIDNSAPELYGNWLRYIIEEYKKVDTKNKYIFINAWNEWAEGNHLEPCQKWGRKYLEETKKAFENQ